MKLKNFHGQIRRLCLFSLSTFIFCFLTSCSFETSSEQPLRVGTHAWIGYETYALAADLGYYEEANLRLVRLSSASDSMNAMRNGSLEAATLTLDETLSLIDEGFDLSVATVIDYSFGGDALIAKPHIRSVNDLKGKVISVEYTAVGAILLDAALESAGLALEEVKIDPCTIDHHAECYEATDAVITFEPYVSRLKAAGGHVLFDSRSIPGRIMDVLVVKRTLSEHHKRQVQQLVNGYFKALGYINSKPEDAGLRVARSIGLSTKEVSDAYNSIKIPSLDQNLSLLSNSTDNLDVIASELATFMSNKGMIKNNNVDRVSDGQYVSSYAETTSQ